jgi:hypothetical protein
MPRQLDLAWTIFFVFCGYSLYTSFVSFMWEEKSRRVFQNLRIPLVVFIYFLVPCVALFLVNAAFGGVRQLSWPFVLAPGFILSISFVVMFYILTVPDWPMGKFLQIDRVPVSFIRALVSVNFAGSLLISIMCGFIIVQTPRAIQVQGQDVKVKELEATSQQLERQKSESTGSLSGIRAVAIRKVLDDNVKTIQGFATLGSTVLAMVVSLRTLGGKKNSKEEGKAARKPAKGKRGAR